MEPWQAARVGMKALVFFKSGGGAIAGERLWVEVIDHPGQSASAGSRFVGKVLDDPSVDLGPAVKKGAQVAIPLSMVEEVKP